MNKEIITNSPLATQKLGKTLVRKISNSKFSDQATIVALEGNLGSGKTTFIKGLARSLGIKDSVLSPTFLILKRFSLASRKYENFYHIDAYRLKNPQELLDLGFKDLTKDPKNIIVIEWADKIKKILPSKAVWIKFINLIGNKRKLTMTADPSLITTSIKR